MRLVIFHTLILLMSLCSAGGTMSLNAYDFRFTSIDGDKQINLSDYKGSMILVVNTASKCGFTKQYEALENLYRNYKNKGLVIIGVPSNDFGGQEPADEKEIKEFCSLKYSVTFPMTEKVKIKGDYAHPFYAWASGASGASPKWNFYKYLIGKNGESLDYFSSMTKPDSKKIINLLEEHL